MVKVTITNSENSPGFTRGELVQLIPSSEDRYPFVVMVGDIPPSSRGSFAGTIMYDEGDYSFAIGSIHDDFSKESFTKFTGKLTMENN